MEGFWVSIDYYYCDVILPTLRQKIAYNTIAKAENMQHSDESLFHSQHALCDIGRLFGEVEKSRPSERLR